MGLKSVSSAGMPCYREHLAVVGTPYVLSALEFLAWAELDAVRVDMV